jgi:hypothetical protein
MEFYKSKGIDKFPSSWPEIITLFLAIISFLLSLRKENRWLFIIPIFFMILSAIFLINDLGLFNRLGRWYRLKRSIKKWNKEAKKQYPKFVLILKKSELFRELMDHLDRAEWCNQNNYPYLKNISFVNWYWGILETAESLKVKRLNEMKLITQRFRDFLVAFNGYYIQTFSTAFKLGQAKYPNEDFKKMIVQLKRRYDDVLTEYDDFCREFNERCANSVLVPIYTHPPDLDWEKGVKP